MDSGRLFGDERYAPPQSPPPLLPLGRTRSMPHRPLRCQGGGYERSSAPGRVPRSPKVAVVGVCKQASHQRGA